MKINEEQFEAHQDSANKQRLAFKKTLTKAQLRVFELAEKLQVEASKNNVPFLLFIAADKTPKSTYRFHNFFSRRFKNVFSPEAAVHAGKWVGNFLGNCIRFMKEVSKCRVIFKNDLGETLMDSDE